LWSRCHLQIAALRSFVDIPSASGMASRASRIPRSTGVRPIASTPRAPREARGNLGVLPACRLASLSACDYYPAICPRSASAPFDRDDIFPRSHAAYGPLDVLRPKAEGDGFFGGTPADVGPGREKRPEPLEHHRDNSGEPWKRVRCSTVELSPKPDGRRSSVRMDVSEARELKTFKTENARLKMLSLP
jgi:hypothetical protein